MEQKKRLVELLKKADESASNKMITDYEDAIKDNADYLIANNVVVLPCEIGATVYYVDKGRMAEATVSEIYFHTNNDWNMVLEFWCEEECKECPFESWSQNYFGEWDCAGEYGYWTVCNEEFGETVFVSKEQAEKKMRDIQNGN
jgi:hypothetical protein